MQIQLIAIGNRMPDWVNDGYREFAKRLPADFHLQLVEIAAGKRGKNADIRRIVQQEGDRMLAAVPRSAHVIALAIEGRPWTTPQLASKLDGWRQEGRDIALLVGGPEGLAPECLARAEQTWSLSPLTLPHPLVRVVIAEQVYRAWSLLHNHPYHR